MPQILVRKIEAKVKSSLEQRARRAGTSLEEEVRRILRRAASEPGRSETGLGQRIVERFAPFELRGEIEELRGEEARPARFER